jgi:hypothetical protein
MIQQVPEPGPGENGVRRRHVLIGHELAYVVDNISDLRVGAAFANGHPQQTATVVLSDPVIITYFPDQGSLTEAASAFYGRSDANVFLDFVKKDRYEPVRQFLACHDLAYLMR